MVDPMSLKFALLGMVIEKPGSGYSLRKRFLQNLKPNLSQIYRTLADMTREGWVDFNKISQDNAPNKKVYYSTPEGEKAFHQWLLDAMPFEEWGTQKHLLPYLTQVWFSYRIKPEDVVKNLETYQAELVNRVSSIDTELKKSRKALGASVDDQRNLLFRELAFKGSTMQMEAIIKWMDYAKDKLLELQADKENSSNRSIHKKKPKTATKIKP